MECFNDRHSHRYKEQRWKSMIGSLYKMRTEKHADVILVCRDRQFSAHKLVLQASSPYFLTMFDCGLEEATSGKVVFDSLEPETLEAILNYIYLGEVKTINSEQLVQDVLAAAHMMQLTGLLDFCFDALSSILSMENCVDIWNISHTYDNKTLKANCLEFILANLRQVSTTGSFLEVCEVKMKELISFAVGKEICLDKVLDGMFDWLEHDLSAREKHVNELFDCLEPRYVGRSHLQRLLRCGNFMAQSPQLASRMNALGVAVFVLVQDCKSQATIRYEAGNLLRSKAVQYSAPVMIHNLPWNIMIRCTSSPGECSIIGFFVQCNRRAKEENWTCKASVEFKLVGREHKKYFKTCDITRDFVFSNTAHTLGESNFIKLEDKNWFFTHMLNDRVVFEAKVIADVPHGIFG